MTAREKDTEDSTVVVAATVDAAHLDYLAVAVRSALDGLAQGWKLRLFVLEYGVDSETKRQFERRFERLSADERLEIEWRRRDLEMIRGRWPGAVGGGVVLYYRLYLGEILPETVDRVLFLDADVLVTGDLSELWRSPFEGAIVQAVPDAYAHELHLPRLRALDLPEDAAPDSTSGYFNAGVLLFDLARWREVQGSAKATSLMWTHGANLQGRDQDALNLVLAGRWKPLSIAWNFHELPERLASWRAPADDAVSLREAARDPRIIHFIGCKPWAGDCLHYGRERWRETARSLGLEAPESTVGLTASLHDLERRLRRLGLGAAARLLLRRPWLLAVYPFWAIWRRMRAKVG